MELSYSSDENTKWLSLSGKVWSFLRKIITAFPYDTAIPLLNIYTDELKSGTQTSTCICMFTAVLFRIGKSENSPKAHQGMNG